MVNTARVALYARVSTKEKRQDTENGACSVFWSATVRFTTIWDRAM